MIGENTHKRGLRQSIDWKLITVYILLVLIGWVNIYASIHSENPTSIIDWGFRSGKQFVWMLTSFGLAGFILFVLPPRFWESASVPMYLAVGKRVGADVPGGMRLARPRHIRVQGREGVPFVVRTGACQVPTR